MRENTRGWWLSKLREPLKSMTLKEHGQIRLDSPCNSMADALSLLLVTEERDSYFWSAVHIYYSNDSLEIDHPSFKQGWKMAQECDPRNKKKFRWTDDKVVDFVNWFLKVKNINQRYEIENIEIINSFKNGDQPEIWK